MSTKIDKQRRELARAIRRTSVEAFHDRLAEAGVTRAYVVWENGELVVSHPKLLEGVQAFFELSQDFGGHEGIFLGREEGIPTIFLAAVHDTRRGLAQGGLRFKPYETIAAVLVDGLRLAQGMTRKNALAGLWWGGGKGIVPITPAIATPAYRTESTPERVALFEAYGRFVASLGGFYYTAEDVGTKTSDMNALLGANRFTTCVGTDHGGSGNPSPATARGVFRGMQAAWQYLHGTDDLQGVKVAVQGVGHVGRALVESLDDARAQVWVTDIDREALARLQAERPRIEVVEDPDSIYDLDVDVLAPCAVGAVVNQHTIPRLEVELVCGAANNILAEPLADAERLRERGITFVPDYLCNRMGVTNCCDESFGYLPGDVALAAEHVYPDTLRVLRHAQRYRMTTVQAADQLADIAAAELHPMIGHRGRRLIDQLIATDWAGTRSRPPRRRLPGPLFEPGRDEPPIRVRWDREKRFRGMGPALAAAPISAAGRPELSSFLPAVMMDVRARAVELLGGERPRRAAGSDHGGLALQLGVERSLSYERHEVGRGRFVELCQDVARRHDAAIRAQLHQLGVGFDSPSWLDSMSPAGNEATRHLYLALKDAGLLFRERRRSYFDPMHQRLLIAPDQSPVERLRGQSTAAFEDRGVSDHLFVRLDEGARTLQRAIASGAVVFSAERFRQRVEKAISDPEPWAISRRQWWGHPLPSSTLDPPGTADEHVLSVWFALVAWSLQAMGWPRQASPEPIAEVHVGPDLLMRWVIPSQVASLELTGRPAFSRVEVHGDLYVPERVLEEREGAQPSDPDEERFVVRHKRRRMRRQLGNVVEPATLIRRFGADALRLGYLLAQNPGAPQVATWAESTLRQGRRAVRRLNAKVSGLDQLLSRLASHGEADAAAEGPDAAAGRAVNAWIRAKTERLVDEAHAGYRGYRLHRVAHLFLEAVDDFGRYAAVAAQRRGVALGEVASTVAAVVRRLADGFSPVCPYLLDKLVERTAARAAAVNGGEAGEALAWIVDLVAELGRHRGSSVRVLTDDDAAGKLLAAGRAELEALARTSLEVSEDPAPEDARTIGPCAVVVQIPPAPLS